ncbi:Oidioi.mRNA.OKI2018_I69.XSR.g13953.t1.cds [Oikopleura dioica]|uniref:Oidioi.mRNA.OKI2018_I69.XSR.g13953.t1.cds n=1 Tax=Oikopleura dioica TaxID=34765 RepID=A0ABN7SD79_OIKDI|nr:Oidioi.mRNA.OKI2018_I69.XSR.g13953.t1.cds [Oikopleura dioica]
MNAFPLLTEFLGFDPAAESDSEERVNSVENNEVEILEDSPVGDEKEYFVKRQIDLIKKTVEMTSDVIPAATSGDDEVLKENAAPSLENSSAISSSFLERTVNQEIEAMASKLENLMKRKKAVDERLAVVKEEIAARAESGMTELALTREKEARQIVLLTLAKMHKELMNDHNKREPKIDLSIEKLYLESLNIAYWQETLAKSSMGSKHQISKDISTSLSTAAGNVLHSLRELGESKADAEVDQLLSSVMKLLIEE